MMKKFIAIITMAVLICIPVDAFADTIGSWETLVKIDSAEVVTRAELGEDGETYIQLRDTLEHLGYRVSWNGEKEMVVAERDNERSHFYVGRNYAIVRGMRIYLVHPIYESGGRTFISLHDLKYTFNIEVEGIDKAEVNNRINGITLKTVNRDYTSLSKEEVEFHKNPIAVAEKFAKEDLKFDGAHVPDVEDKEPNNYIHDNRARVYFKEKDGVEIHVDLNNIAFNNEPDKWIVDSWYDENSTHYNVRDLNALNENMFYLDPASPREALEFMNDYIVKKWTDDYSKHYQVVGFETQTLSNTYNGNDYDLKFILTTYTKNYAKDPDTVEYIANAADKEVNILYDEYNMIKLQNEELKVVLKLDDDGNVIPESFKVYHNISPNGEEYIEVK